MDKQKVIRAALLGYGTVGSGVYALESRLKDEIVKKTGAALEIKKILVRSLGKKREGADPSLFTDNWNINWALDKNPKLRLAEFSKN